MICFTMNFELCENILLTGRGWVFEANGKSGGCAGAASIGGRGDCPTRNIVKQCARVRWAELGKRWVMMKWRIRRCKRCTYTVSPFGTRNARQRVGEQCD